jgi:hypothetical protein
MDSINIVNAALAKDKEAFTNAFNLAITDRVSNALEVRKVEIASSLLNTEEEPNEVETIETEVDGSTSSDDGAEPTTTETT